MKKTALKAIGANIEASHILVDTERVFVNPDLRLLDVIPAFEEREVPGVPLVCWGRLEK